MYIFKNSLTNILRNKGRNILMGVIIIVIAIACTVTLAIRNSANTLIDSYESGSEIVATIGVNREQMMENFTPGSDNMEENREKFSSISSVTKEEVLEYGDSDYVKYYYYTYNLGVNSSDIEPASSTTNEDEENSSMPGGRKISMAMSSGDFSLSAYSSLDAMTDFIEGNYTIVDGSIDTDFEAMSCVINEELATVNELSVGDTITVVSPNDEDLTYELTITGIYKENESTSTMNMSMFTNSANTIITNTTVAESILEDDEEMTSSINPTFVLTGSDVIEKFSEELTDKGLADTYQVTNNLESIESETSSIKNVATYVTTFLIITLIIGAIVLFVLNMINVRERKYEIGVLRTIGMKKSLVASQFITELLFVTIVALVIGFGIGSPLSVPVANKLLESEIESQTSEAENISNNFGGNMITQGTGGGERQTTFKSSSVNTNIDYVTEIDAVVDFTVLLQLLGLGILLTLISSSASIISINKFSPLSILKERS